MESPYYRDNLEQILAFSHGRQLLKISDVCRFCGVKDGRTIKARYPFVDGRITAATLARCMCGGVSR